MWVGLFDEFYFDSNDEITLQISHHQSIPVTISPYKNGKRNGRQLWLDSKGRVTKQIEYRAGIKHGERVNYDSLGNVTEVANFKNGRETTLYSTSIFAPKVDGFSKGHHAQSSPNGTKIWEGEYWMGYLVGEYVNYRPNGSYSISYYPTDHQTILQVCNNDGPIKIESYDKEGQLTMMFPE
ncbi:MAG: toxin-antitoxin system YwqK family antitoxin [Saprospiraceae bacterium]